jgi:hypothetical protein
MLESSDDLHVELRKIQSGLTQESCEIMNFDNLKEKDNKGIASMISKAFKVNLIYLFFSLALTGCASKTPESVSSSTPPAKHVISTMPSIKTEHAVADANPQQVSQLLVVWVAGYCQGWADASGQDFEKCFKLTTEDTVKRYRERTGVDLTDAAQEAIGK